MTRRTSKTFPKKRDSTTTTQTHFGIDPVRLNQTWCDTNQHSILWGGRKDARGNDNDNCGGGGVGSVSRLEITRKIRMIMLVREDTRDSLTNRHRQT